MIVQKILTKISESYHVNFTRGGFGHNVMVMFVGTTIGQLASVILSPALTRLYTPETFGVLGAFTAALTILSVIAALRYELALPLTTSQEDTANMLAVCGVALVVTTAASALLLMAIPISALGELAPYRMLMPIGFFCIGAYQILVYYATRLSNFDAIARTKVYQGLAGPLTQIGLGLAKMGSLGLIIGFIIGQSTGISLLVSRLLLQSRGAMRGVSIAGMKSIANRYIRFPLISSWSALINAAGTSALLLVVVPILYSSEIAGFIFLTDRIIGRPLLLISTSILQVYVGEASKSVTADPEGMRRRFLQLARHQLVIVASWLLLVNIAAPSLFGVIFGQEWQGAVPYLQILSICYLPQMVIHALLHTLQILERQGLSATWETGRLIAIIGAFALSRALGLDALHALLLYSIAQAVAQIILFILMYQSIQSLQKVAHAEV